MSAPSFGLQVDRASGEVRAAYLRRVLGLTFVGLSIAAFTGLLGMAALMLVPSLLSGYVPMVIVLGMWAITNYVARPMVFGNAKWAGFLLGTVADGIALSFILTIAALVSMADYGNPFVLVALAVGLTAASGTGLAAFACWQGQEKNVWFPGPALGPFAPPPPTPTPGKSPTGPFALGDPRRTRRILQEAGFIDIRRTPKRLALWTPADSVADEALFVLMGVPKGKHKEATVAMNAHFDKFPRRADGLLRFELSFQLFTARNP